MFLGPELGGADREQQCDEAGQEGNWPPKVLVPHTWYGWSTESHQDVLE
jgi:hypothetical protein